MIPRLLRRMQRRFAVERELEPYVNTASSLFMDRSFLNWRPLSYALLKNIVPDFPLCNKSFNQSYSGNDL